MLTNQIRLWIVATGVLVAVLALVAAQPGKQRAPIKRGAPLPKMVAGKNFVSLNASEFGNLRDKLRGKVVLVNFWATWCPPCRMEIPHLETLYQKYKKKDFVLLGVTDDVPSQDVLKLFQEQVGLKISYHVIQDDASEIFQQFEIRYRPTTIVYDRYGEQRFAMNGYRDGMVDELEKLVDELLAE